MRILSIITDPRVVDRILIGCPLSCSSSKDQKNDLNGFPLFLFFFSRCLFLFPSFFFVGFLFNLFCQPILRRAQLGVDCILAEAIL
jgi:hypothetical protein